MRILTGIDALRTLRHGSAMAVGNFDGVHRGHRHICRRLGELAAAGGGGASGAGGAAEAAERVVVTFEPHPLTVLKPEKAPPRLTPSGLKRDLLAGLGVDVLIELPPDQTVLNLSAEAFWHILRDEARPAHLVQGENFTFGRAAAGTTPKLAAWAQGTGVQVHVVEPVEVALCDFTVVDVSSTIVRWLIAYGRARDAAICLGAPYTLAGEVVEGYRRGNTIGFPTANLACGEQWLPADGVYAARATVDGTDWPAALSIGTTPTFEGVRRQVEAHLVGFNGNLYGRTLRLEVLDWLRGQRPFPDVTHLKAQLARDVAAAAGYDCDVKRPLVDV
ncbi:MAG: bifunctional riboflavin kinase/FMN adenylyltransferase [Phycisphaerae bacterium]